MNRKDFFITKLQGKSRLVIYDQIRPVYMHIYISLKIYIHIHMYIDIYIFVFPNDQFQFPVVRFHQDESSHKPGIFKIDACKRKLECTVRGRHVQIPHHFSIASLLSCLFVCVAAGPPKDQIFALPELLNLT